CNKAGSVPASLPTVLRFAVSSESYCAPRDCSARAVLVGQPVVASLRSAVLESSIAHPSSPLLPPFVKANYPPSYEMACNEIAAGVVVAPRAIREQDVTIVGSSQSALGGVRGRRNSRCGLDCLLPSPTTLTARARCA